MNRRHCLGLLAGGIAAASAATAAAFPRANDLDRIRAEVWNRDRRYMDTPYGAIAYADVGRGDAALFLHGFPLNGFQWRGAIERLSISLRCIAPDLLGMGFTRVAPGQDLGPAAQAAMVIALLDRLRLDRVHVVANDSGGAVAQLLVAHHPERVRTLLLTNCDTAIESPPAAMAPVIALARQGRFAESWLAPWLADKALARSPQGLGGMCFADPANPSDAALDMYLGPLVASAERRALTDAYALALETNALADIGKQLAACPVPVRILWGTADTIFSSAGASYLDTAFGRSLGIRNIAGAKLFWPEEQPALLAEEARALWAG